MSQTVISDVGKLIIDVLIANERLHFALKFNKADTSDAIYFLYSSALKLIYKVVSADMRQCRLFRLKYHHILSNDSVEEYLFHCLSKILSEVLDEENSYQRFIQPVAELHVKLMSIVTQVQLQHYDVVCANRKVRQEIHKNQNLLKASLTTDGFQANNVDDDGRFIPVYFVPSHQLSSKLNKSQFLTFQAINKHYLKKEVDSSTMAMLLDFDKSFAEFELDFVCQVNKSSTISVDSAEKTMDVAILFAEAVKWAHHKGMLKYSSIADCDIEIMVGIPRLCVLYGCGVAKYGPLSEWSLLHDRSKTKGQSQLAPVFENHFTELARLRRQLNVLNGLEMAYLCRLLLDHQGDLPGKASTSDYDNRIDQLKIDDWNHLVSGDVHALFKLISSVSDQMQSEHASDYRFFMETVYKLFKDESDDTNPSSPVPIVKALSTSDLFLESPYVTSIIDVDEAVEALSYVIVDERASSKSMWDIKSCHSPSLTSGKTLQQVDYKDPETHILDPCSNPNRPKWQHDSSCSKCCHCGISFNIFRRRHHCRRCGYLFCNSCWGAKITLPSLGIHSQVPVCVECEDFIHGSRHTHVATATPQRAS